MYASFVPLMPLPAKAIASFIVILSFTSSATSVAVFPTSVIVVPLPEYVYSKFDVS